MENGIVFIAKGIYASSIGRHCLLPVKGKTSAANFETVHRGKKSGEGRGPGRQKAVQGESQ